MPKTPNFSAAPAELRRLAEARLRDRKIDVQSDADARRVLHELEVHRIELELQNAELQRARNELEAALERYTDLYDFAPVGYLSVDEAGTILEANLTGAALFGVERSRLIRRRLSLFVDPKSRPDFLASLKRVFTGSDEEPWQALLLKEGAGTFWASFRATSAGGPDGSGRWCRLVFGDITARKQADETQRRMETLAATNLGLKQEIGRRQKVEKALQKSERTLSRMLVQSGHLQHQLRRLSHQILNAQEEERKRISRELHDEIAQTLVGINVRLATLTQAAVSNPKTLRQKISQTQQLVERSVDVVHRFARELRPTALDDLGLVPALHSFMKEFAKRSGVRAHLTGPKNIEHLTVAERTVLYRVAQEALTNVARHARASRVDVTIRKAAGRVSLTVADDGRSFPVQRVMHSRGGTHLGLLGMRERLEMVGGSLRVESARGKGTTIHAEIPLDESGPGDGESGAP